MRRALSLAAVVVAASVLCAPAAAADNSRLNNGVVANVYTVQHQAGCTGDIKVDPALRQAAQWHAQDVLNNRTLDGDLGSDGSTPQSRAAAAGFVGRVSQTVAINPALAINNLDVIQQWYYDPAPTRSCPTAPTPPSGCGRRTVWTVRWWWRCTASR